MRWQKSVLQNNGEPAINLYDLLDYLQELKSLSTRISSELNRQGVETTERDDAVIAVSVKSIIETISHELRAQRESIRF